ncbi:MAG: hypothetical protein ACPGNV_14270 [Mangrovicoccus sp.]
MPEAIFKSEFHYSSRKKNVGWSAYPSDGPQSFPSEFIDAAIEAGCAEVASASKEPPKS